MFMRSFAAREAARPRAMALLAPGWIRTDRGGPEAPCTVEQCVPPLVDLLIVKRGVSGLQQFDRFGQTEPR